MLIIVEGVDGVGKSTFIDALADKMREVAPDDTVLVLHAGPPEHPPLVEYELPLQWYYPGDGSHVVCDRWHLGNLVYGPRLRQETTDPIQNFHIEKFLRARGVIVVGLAAAPGDIISRRGGRDKADLITDEQVAEVQDDYLDVLWDTALPVKLVNVDRTPEDPRYEKMILEVLHDARSQELDMVDVSAFRTYAGPCHPQVLILGERRNPNGDLRWDTAFVPEGGTAGRYLFQSMTADIKAISGFANAMEENVAALYNTLGQPAVVTLGKEAHLRVSEENIPHGSVPHPQYIRRFHHAHGREYGSMIRRAALFEEELIQWRP